MSMIKTTKTPSKKTAPAAAKPVAPAVATNGPAAKPVEAKPATPAAAPKAAAPAVVARREITSDNIASRAYLLWEQAGRPHGRDLEFWSQAEHQVQQTAHSFSA